MPVSLPTNPRDDHRQNTAFLQTAQLNSGLGIPRYDQGATNACGTTSLAMIMTGLGKHYSPTEIDARIRRSDTGTSVQNMMDFARENGLSAEYYNDSSLDEIKQHLSAGRGLQVLFDTADASAVADHYAVVTGFSTDTNGNEQIHLIDPNGGRDVTMSIKEFMDRWQSRVGDADRFMTVYGQEGDTLPPSRIGNAAEELAVMDFVNDRGNQGVAATDTEIFDHIRSEFGSLSTEELLAYRDAGCKGFGGVGGDKGDSGGDKGGFGGIGGTAGAGVGGGKDWGGIGDTGPNKDWSSVVDKHNGSGKDWSSISTLGIQSGYGIGKETGLNGYKSTASVVGSSAFGKFSALSEQAQNNRKAGESFSSQFGPKANKSFTASELASWNQHLQGWRTHLEKYAYVKTDPSVPQSVKDKYAVDDQAFNRELAAFQITKKEIRKEKEFSALVGKFAESLESYDMQSPPLVSGPLANLIAEKQLPKNAMDVFNSIIRIQGGPVTAQLADLSLESIQEGTYGMDIGGFAVKVSQNNDGSATLSIGRSGTLSAFGMVATVTESIEMTVDRDQYRDAIQTIQDGAYLGSMAMVMDGLTDLGISFDHTVGITGGFGVAQANVQTGYDFSTRDLAEAVVSTIESFLNRNENQKQSGFIVMDSPSRNIFW